MKELNILVVIQLLLLFGINSQNAYSQVSVDHEYRHDFIKQIGNSDEIVYTFNGVPKALDKHELILFNAKGEKLSTYELQAKQGMILENCISIGENSLFYFTYNYQKVIMFLMLDKNGIEIKRKEIEVLKTANEAIVKPYGNDKFYFASNIKDKKAGLLIEVFDLNIEPVWQYRNVPEKSKYFLEQTNVSAEGNICVIYTEKSSDFKFLSLDNTGQVIADKAINIDGLSSFTPYLFEFISNNEILLVSDYGLASNSVFMSTSLGINIKHFTLEGEETQNDKLSFLKTNEKYGELLPDGTPVLKESPALRALAIETINGKPTMICESFVIKDRVVSTPGSTPQSAPTKVSFKTIQLLDLFLVNLENIEDIHQIWTPSRFITLEGTNNFFTTKAFCEELTDTRMFTYQGIKNDGLLVRGFGQNHEYFNIIPFDAPYDNLLSRTYWGYPIDDAMPRQNFTQTFKKASFVPISAGTMNGFLPTNKGTLLYHNHTTTGNLQFTVLN